MEVADYEQEAGEEEGGDETEEAGVPEAVGVEADEGGGAEAESEGGHEAEGGECSEGGEYEAAEVEDFGVHKGS